MKTAFVLPALAALLLSSPDPAVVHAGPSRSFRVTSYKDFAEGQDQGVLLSSDGSAQPGLASERLALPALTDDSVRALTVTSDGTTYVGTGGDSPGILTLVPGGKLLQPLTRLPAQTWVTALCALPDGKGGPGEVLAATAQDGRIFAIDRAGKVRVHAKVEGDHVWALVHDPRRGVTYAATGPGRLWEVDGQGRVTRLFDSGAKQILALDLGADGAIYLGTADDAVLYRVEPGRGGAAVRALHDFAGNELRAIAHHGGTLFVAVNDMSRGQSSGGVRITPAPSGTAPGSGPRPGGGGGDRAGKGALFRVDESGRVEQLHAISDGFFNAATVDTDGNLFAAASTPGGRGRLYLVRPDRTVVTAAELKESDVLALLVGGAPDAKGQPERRGKPQHLLGTGNSGALYRLEAGPPRDGHYLSKIFDGQFLSRWGVLRYTGAGNLRLETRSGNLAKPDGTWSAWQPLGKPERAAAPGELTGRIASPHGRYLQVRVFLGERSVLNDFTVSYQPLNQRPRLLEITVGEDPLGRIARGARSSSGSSSGNTARARQPLVKLKFRVENPDEDELSYRLYLRAVPAPTAPASPAAAGGAVGDAALIARAKPGDLGWLRLGGPEPLSKPEFEWNTESVPDGVYELRVVVSDERANPPGEALSHELTTAPFVVDNRRPELSGVTFAPGSAGATDPAGSAGTISGKAVDGSSPLAELAYSVDGGEFLPAGARDGVLDELAEEFAFRLPRLSPGPHAIVVRATDAADNAAAVQLVVTVPAMP